MATVRRLKSEAAFLAKNIPGSRLITIKGAGHFPNLEQPKRFNAAAETWLREQVRRAEVARRD